MNKKDILIEGDALQVLPTLEADSVDAVITDPPYFLDKLDNEWDAGRVQKAMTGHVVSHLPAGMKLDPEQGRRFYQWYHQIALQIYQVLRDC